MHNVNDVTVGSTAVQDDPTVAQPGLDPTQTESIAEAMATDPGAMDGDTLSEILDGDEGDDGDSEPDLA